MIAQTTWGWFLVWELFLGWVGAGTYIIGVFLDFWRLKFRLASKIGVMLGPLLILVRTVLQFADLGRPMNAIYILGNPSSMISIGVVVIMVFLVVGAIHIGLWIWPFKVLEKAEKARRLLGLLGVLFAFGTALYAGILLGVVAAVPFWNNSMLPALFLISALSTGLALVTFGSAVFRRRSVGVTPEDIQDSIRHLAKANAVLIGAELFVIATYLIVVHGPSPAADVSVQLLLAGYLAPFFWAGLVLVGLALPLGLNLLGIARRAMSSLGMYMLSSVFVLTGSLVLSYLILAAGVPVTYEPLFGTQAFFTIPAFLGSSGSELTSLVPGMYDYALIGAFFVVLLIVYGVGSVIPVGGKK